MKQVILNIMNNADGKFDQIFLFMDNFQLKPPSYTACRQLWKVLSIAVWVAPGTVLFKITRN